MPRAGDQPTITDAVGDCAPSAEDHVAARDASAAGLFARAWRTTSAVVGASLGLLPHVLHHVGLVFGAALVTGAAGNVLFGALGLLLSVPLLRRLYTRFATWKAPAVGLVGLVATFSVSAFVIGPAIAGDGPVDDPRPVGTPDHSGHDGH